MKKTGTAEKRKDLPHHQPIPFASLDFIPIYTDNKVKLSVYPYMRMGIVTTTSHPVFSFHCIPLFLFLPSFLEIPWSSIIMVPTEYLQEYLKSATDFKWLSIHN